MGAPLSTPSFSMQFCRRCSAPLTRTSSCFRCDKGHNIFANPAPTVGVLLLTPKGDVVLSRRGIEPQKGKLDALGGFVELGETLEEAALRELSEEAGLLASDLPPLAYLCSQPTTYPYDGEINQLITIFFTCIVPSSIHITPADDAAEVVHIPLSAIPMGEISSDDVKKALHLLQRQLTNVK